VGGFYLAMFRLYPADLSFYMQEAFGPTEHEWTIKYFLKALIPLFRNGIRMDINYLLPLTLAGVPLLVLFSGRGRRSRLVQACALWLAVAFVFFDIRGKLPLRYYIPLIAPCALALGYVLLRAIRAWWSTIWSWLPAALLIGVVAVGIVRTLDYMATLQYSYMQMADDIRARVRTDGFAQPRIAGNIAETLCLATGIPAVNYDFGADTVENRLAAYAPQYYVMLGANPDILEALSKIYRVEPIATYHVFGDYYQGKSVNLYRLTPRNANGQ
jgi:hypothetical protein